MLPGNVHDLAAARENVLPVLRNYTGKMPGLADCGYEGAGHGILTPWPVAACTGPASALGAAVADAGACCHEGDCPAGKY